jgi:hypothetical protein
MTRHLAILVLLAACGADVADKPTWLGDVQPIVRANCARCHGADPAEDKLGLYRLDRSVALDVDTRDAFDYSSDIVDRAVHHMAPVMPPDYLLSDRQQEILLRWASTGALKGMDQRGNTLGRIELISPQGATTADQTIETTFRSWDEDLDGLVVGLWARDSNGESFSLGAPVGGGTRSISVDAGTLTSKATFEVYAIVDDGYDDDPAINKRNEIVLIPEILIDHGLRGTAPRVTLKTPNGGDTIIGATTITWIATDPDAGDSLTIDLDLVPQTGATTPIPIVHGIPNSQTFDWTIPTSVPERDSTGTAIPYKVRVTATDALGQPQNVRSDDSDFSFFIERAVVTQYSWLANTKQIFKDYCTSNCHDKGGVGSHPEYCFLEYDQGESPTLCDPTDIGAFEARNQILSVMVLGTTMPPKSAPQPSQATRDLVGDWIRGGAPYGDGGTSDTAPTFVWTAPAGGKLLASAGVAALAWTVADSTALVSDEIRYRKLKGTNAASPCSNDCTAMSTQFDASTPTWISLTTGALSGTMQSRTFDWSTPSQGAGCYCVEGTVTDNASPANTTTVRAQNAVKF